MASVLALQCSTNWAMKTHTLGAGQFADLTHERNKVSTTINNKIINFEFQ